MANEISKITLPNGTTYDICDSIAREQLSHSLELVIVETLPTAAAGTMGKIYLVPSTQEAQDNIYDEYVTVRTGTSTYTYTWEKIGTTRTELSDYSLKTHKHSVTSNVSVAAHSYTPAGSVEGSATQGSTSATGGNHTHTVSKTIRYLHPVSVPRTFSKSSVPSSVATSKMVTTTVSKMTAGSAKNVAKAGTAVSVPNVTGNTSVTASKVTSTSDNRATGALGTETATRGADTPMWGATVNDGVLSFTFKPLSVASTVASMSVSDVTATNTTLGTAISITPAVDNGTVVPYTKEDVTVATGSLASTGTGAQVATGAGGTVEVHSGVATEADSFSINDTASGGTGVVTAVGDAAAAGAHSHTISATFSGTTASINHSVTNGTVNTSAADA